MLLAMAAIVGMACFVFTWNESLFEFNTLVLYLVTMSLAYLFCLTLTPYVEYWTVSNQKSQHSGILYLLSGLQLTLERLTNCLGVFILHVVLFLRSSLLRFFPQGY